MKHISELVAGDEVVGYLKLGVVLRVGSRPDGSGFRYVTQVSSRTKINDLTRFIGTVGSNAVGTKILTCATSPMNSRMRPESHTDRGGFGYGGVYQAELHYSSFSRLRLLSKINFPGKARDPTHPTVVDPLGGNAFRPYRTLEEISVK